MRLRITITDENGQIFEGAADLSPVGGARRAKATGEKKKPPAKPENVSFAMNVRAFMRKYGGDKSAHANFALILARLVSGDVGKELAYEDVAQVWNSMKSILGGKLHAVYALRARERGWVDSPKRGVYVLTADWRDSLEG